MSKKIVQIDDNDELVRTWDNSKEIAKALRPGQYLHYQCFNQAIKTGFRSHGFFWMMEKDWNEGKRPEHDKATRNTPIYAYKPKVEVAKRDYHAFDYTEHEMVFLGKYENAVLAAKALDISVSNVRCVLKGDHYNSNDELVKGKKLHKGFWFSYIALSEEDEEKARKFLIEQEHDAYNKRFG